MAQDYVLATGLADNPVLPVPGGSNQYVTIHTSPDGVDFLDLVYIGVRSKPIVEAEVQVIDTTDSSVVSTQRMLIDSEQPIVLPPNRRLSIRNIASSGAVMHYITASVLRQSNVGSTFEEANVQTNGVDFDTVAAGGNIDIPVLDEDDDEVGTTIPGDKHLVANSELTVNGDPLASIKPEQPHALTVEYLTAGVAPVTIIDENTLQLPDPGDACGPAELTTNGDSPALEIDSGDSLNLNIHNSAAADIGVRTGDTVVIGDMTLDYPDATTQALVIVPGSTVTIPPHWTIQLTGTVASPFTVVSPAWDASFVCATETLTGGTISGITINGAPSIATFVGATIPASATIVVTFASSLTQVVLTFS